VLVDELAPDRRRELQAESAGRFELAVGDEVGAEIERLDSLILSPGVPADGPHCRRAAARGIPVVSELEVAARNCGGYIVAVTGTNGKSTTTKLLGHVLSALGPTHVLGNIGTPLIASAGEIGPDDFVALEVSSYQLEAVEQFAPRIAIFTNLTPDHLTRHGSMEDYARIKRRMAGRMDSGGFVIANALTPEFSRDSFENKEPVYLQFRSTPGNRLRGAWLGNGLVNVDLGSETHSIPLDSIKLPGLHNVENAMCVILAALLVGVSEETIAERLASFTGYEHRLELCREHNGVRFYNDSKATNPEATVTALKAMDKPLVLILGGRDKLTDLGELCQWVKRKALAVVTYGEAAQRFEENLAASGYNKRCSRADGLEDAIRIAVDELQGNSGSVLLSPACASFDQYESYEARGEHFKELAGRLE
jgi:UDP-N-acetylmuramoylalanine--D-glutamate ligase